jgi:hypothetical protein
MHLLLHRLSSYFLFLFVSNQNKQSQFPSTGNLERKMSAYDVLEMKVRPYHAVCDAAAVVWQSSATSYLP